MERHIGKINKFFNVRPEDKRRFFSSSYRIQTTLHTTGLLSRLKTDLKLPVYMLTGTDIFSASSFFSVKTWKKLEKYVHSPKCQSNVNKTTSSSKMHHPRSKDESSIKLSHKLCCSDLHNCRAITLITQQKLF